MSGIIKREDAIREICLDRCGTSPDEYRCGAMEDGTCEIINRINDLPSVDAVEVIRCRDCKHYKPDAEPEYERCRHHIISMDPEDWCSYGERMEP